MSRRLAKLIAPGIALIVASAVLGALADGSVGLVATALALLGLGGVYLVSLVFYEIGLSEDRDREQRPHG